MKALSILIVAAAILSAGCATRQAPPRVVNRLPPTPDAGVCSPGTDSMSAIPQMPQQPPIAGAAIVPLPTVNLASQESPTLSATSATLLSPQPANTGVIPASALQPVSLAPTPLPNPPETIPPGAPTTAGPSAFVLADLEGMALANNPTLTQASARVQAARGTWQQVGRYPNPLVGYQGVEIGNENRAGQQGVYLEQEFVLGKKRQLSQNAASQAVRQAEQDFEAQQLRVMNDVRIAFFETLVAQRRVEITQELLGVGQKGLNATDKLLKAQEVSQADLIQSRIEFSNAQLLSGNAQSVYQANWRQLTAVLGVPALSPQPLNGDLYGGIGECELTWENALRNLLSNSPELASAYAGVERARWALSRERAEPIPNIDVQLTMQHDNATTSDIAGVQAVLPLPIFNRNRGNISRAEAELTFAQREVNRLELDLQHRLAAAFGRYTMAKQAAERYSTEILSDANKSLELVSAGYRQGEYSFLALLTAQRTYFQTNLAYLDALREARESRIAIEGMLLTGSLSANASPIAEPQGASYGVVPVMGRL